MKKSSLVIVYHRQPYEEVVENGRTVYREHESPNGIVPTLKSFFGRVVDGHGAWVAWKQVNARRQDRFERIIEINDRYGSYVVSRLPLSPEQVRSFYHVTSKEALWPILHSFPWLFRYENVDWSTFREVNALFAQAAADQAADDGLVWIHDYNLWLVPKYLRQLKPKVRIAFFHHTPFPARSSTACSTATWSGSTFRATPKISPTWRAACATCRSSWKCPSRRACPRVAWLCPSRPRRRCCATATGAPPSTRFR